MQCALVQTSNSGELVYPHGMMVVLHNSRAIKHYGVSYST